MSKYPEEITKYRPKGTVIKKINNQYYVYEATSKRIPGKSYPVQIIGSLIGKIDNKGFLPFNRVKLNLDEVEIRECGFTNYLMKFEDDFILNPIGNVTSKREKRHIYKNIIVYLSPSSFLNESDKFNYEDIKELESKYDFSLIRQLTSIEKMIGRKLSDLNDLKSICKVKAENKLVKTTLTERQKALIKQLGVNEDDIR